jgi:hypothetical protein
MSDTTRRDILRNAAISALLGTLSVDAAQHVHNETGAEKKTTGTYKPKLFTAHEYATVRRLAELIVPKDEKSPSALDAGAPEFIDLLCSQNKDLADIYTGGILWLDGYVQKKHGKSFVEATAEQQTTVLDVISFRKNSSPETAPGIRFFDWCRKMVVDAFYTSPIGYKDVGFLGNKGAAKFVVPAASLDYALKKSGLA